MHVAVYTEKAGLTEFRLCDALQETCAIDDALWSALTANHSGEAILPLEAGVRRFPTD